MSELTYGEEAVGLKFNHAEGVTPDEVHEVKVTFAKLIDLVESKRTANDSRLANTLKTFAVTSLIATQMAVVKVLTWKDQA